MFKLLLAALIVACVAQWAIILTPDNLRYEDKVCPPQAKPIHYPDGMRVPVCNPTGIVWRPNYLSERG